MALKILNDTITSSRSPHVARSRHGSAWTVSWLPGRLISRNEAITSMVLADETADGMEPEHRLWAFVEGWAGELGLTAADVLTRTAAAPDRTGPRPRSGPADPGAAE